MSKILRKIGANARGAGMNFSQMAVNYMGKLWSINGTICEIQHCFPRTRGTYCRGAVTMIEQ